MKCPFYLFEPSGFFRLLYQMAHPEARRAKDLQDKILPRFARQDDESGIPRPVTYFSICTQRTHWFGYRRADS